MTRRTRTAVRDEVGDGSLLEFLAPGVVHAIGNHLFAIHGQARLLGRGSDGGGGGRERSAILEAAERAEQVLDVVRCLTEEPRATGPSQQAGIVLSRLCALYKVPLRERGIRIHTEHSSDETPRFVAVAQLVRALTATLSAMCNQLPTGVRGLLAIDLCRQNPVSVQLQLDVEPSYLPFRFDLTSVCGGVRAYLAEIGAGLEGPSDDGELVVTVPSVA